MINSLLKDSHITHSLSIPIFRESSNEKQNNSISRAATLSSLDNNDRFMRKSAIKPAEISFGGFYGAKLANAKSFEALMTKVDSFIPKGEKLAKTRDFVSRLISVSNGDGKSANELTTKFLSGGTEKEQNELKGIIEKVSSDAKDLVYTAENKNKKTDNELNDDFRDTITSAVDGFRGIQEAKSNPKSLYNSKFVKWCLEKAQGNQVLFNALFSLVLTCVLRPASILLMPGDKKNNDDKKYASAHSIASGVISLGIAILISNPISKATTKITDHPDTFIPDKANYLRQSKKSLFGGTTAIKMLTETLYSPPKAMVTIALIPIILKNVFGLSKGKKAENQNMNNKTQISGGVK